MTASLTLSAFGQAVASSGSSTSAYQYGATSGYRSEGDAGLTLVGCRFYDAQVGRFITRDTYLDQAPYAYCDGDPVNAVDPSGHDPSAPSNGLDVNKFLLDAAKAGVPISITDGGGHTITVNPGPRNPQPPIGGGSSGGGKSGGTGVVVTGTTTTTTTPGKGTTTSGAISVKDGPVTITHTFGPGGASSTTLSVTATL